MSHDPHHTNLINMRVYGLWDASAAYRFSCEMDALIAQLSVPHGQHLTCMDITAFKIQSQAVIAICLQIVTRGLLGRRSAFIEGEGLGRIQVKRVIHAGNIRVFDHMAPAHAWLFDDTADDTPPAADRRTDSRSALPNASSSHQARQPTPYSLQR